MMYLCGVRAIMIRFIVYSAWWSVLSGAVTATSFSLKLWTWASLGAQLSRAKLDFNSN